MLLGLTYNAERQDSGKAEDDCLHLVVNIVDVPLTVYMYIIHQMELITFQQNSDQHGFTKYIQHGISVTWCKKISICQ